MKHNFYCLILVLILLAGCNKGEQKTKTSPPQKPVPTLQTQKPSKSRPARILDSLGMVNIAEADSTIVVDLMYGKPDNFTGKVLYHELKEAYLHPKAARALLKAQRLLRKLHPQYRLIIYDAARPLSIQGEMWNVVKGTSRNIYVSNPAHGGGLHNYGLAVDISIVDDNGKALDMGTPVDFMGKAAHITKEQELVHKNIISRQALEHRLLLRHVMRQAGFRPLPSEWWHFNYCSRKIAHKYYKPIP